MKAAIQMEVIVIMQYLYKLPEMAGFSEAKCHTLTVCNGSLMLV